ncbi:hypothetical protein JMG10_08760 [Nostoc ellipsosporum NOK]|nr:hypothetical protein [Nostoc ellipsosporum NOK]
MNQRRLILLWLILCFSGRIYGQQENIHFDFYGDPVEFSFSKPARSEFTGALSSGTIIQFYQQLDPAPYASMISALKEYKNAHQPDDWLFYQLIRRTAQAFSPKEEDYLRYTLYKWYLLSSCGYDAMLAVSGQRILFYVQSDEHIYNIPSRIVNGRQYVCLNFHDYKGIDPTIEFFTPVDLKLPEAINGFSYRITRLPGFNDTDYKEKELSFRYYQQDYHFRVKVNQQVKTIFANYPVVDYDSYFNIPLSRETYSSLIPLLRKNVQHMRVRDGVDYLMRFTRYAFLFEPDTEQFGAEKRLTPEQTLLNDKSDCDDRAALFFYLVKEIYNLPMLVLSFPNHVTIAIKFDKPVGKTIEYNGEKYSMCEPTPQQDDLALGDWLPQLRKQRYEIAYAYQP